MCGNSWNSRQLGESWHYIHGDLAKKKKAERRYLIVALSTVITKLSVKS